MKTFKEFFLFLAVLAPIGAILLLCSPARAEECTATVSPEIRVHLPAVQVDTGIYSADLQYAPSNDGIIWYDLAGVSAADALTCGNPALFTPVSGNYFLYVPSVAIGADKFWATLQYVPPTAATQTNAAAAAAGPRFKLTNANREGVMEPPGTQRVPTSMMFSSAIRADQGPGGWKLNITMKSSQIQLGVPLATLTPPPGYNIGPSDGALFAVEATCSYNQIVPEVTATCRVDGFGIGSFFVDSLAIADVNSSNPQITMNYHISFPPNQLVMHTHICHIPTGQCFDDSTDVSSGGPNVYVGFHPLAPGSGSIVASGWSLLPGLGSPCNGCGWPYAEKVYPDNRRVVGQASWEELRTHIVLYE